MTQFHSIALSIFEDATIEVIFISLRVIVAVFELKTSNRKRISNIFNYNFNMLTSILTVNFNFCQLRPTGYLSAKFQNMI